jgi:hypothetical protein
VRDRAAGERSARSQRARGKSWRHGAAFHDNLVNPQRRIETHFNQSFWGVLEIVVSHRLCVSPLPSPAPCPVTRPPRLALAPTPTPNPRAPSPPPPSAGRPKVRCVWRVGAPPPHPAPPRRTKPARVRARGVFRRGGADP